jgi:DNA polymerase
MKNTNEISELIADVREQVVYFKELGVELLDVTMAEGGAVESEPPITVVAARADVAPDAVAIPRELPDVVVPAPIEIPKPSVKRPSKLSALPSLSNRAQVGKRAKNGNTLPAENEIHDANSAELNLPIAPSILKDALFDAGPEMPQVRETVEDIRRDIGDCTRCELYSGRTQVVHSTGNLQADLMFVGEAPGADEDEQGFPFVGRAGQLLTKIIEGIGFKREDVFIGNINRCRPPGNRAPTLPEAHTCRPFLLREIGVVRPRVIVVMGNTALHNLLDTKDGITKVRGTFQDYFGVKVMPTFHPAYLLRDPHKKREVWDDMKKVRDYLKG